MLRSLQLPLAAACRCRSEPPLDGTRTFSRQGGSLESLHNGGKRTLGGLRQRRRNSTNKRRRNGTRTHGRRRNSTNATQRYRTHTDATQHGESFPRGEGTPRGYATGTHGDTTRYAGLGYDHGCASDGQTAGGGRTREQDGAWVIRLHVVAPPLRSMFALRSRTAANKQSQFVASGAQGEGNAVVTCQSKGNHLTESFGRQLERDVRNPGGVADQGVAGVAGGKMQDI